MSTDSVDNDHMAMQRTLKMLKLAVFALAGVWMGTTAWLFSRTPEAPDVLSVERLEIVEPDGSLALVLANSRRPVAATLDGEVVMEGQEEERRGVPSIIFFDGKGDEVGGMLFGVEKTADGYSAVRHLSLDGYKQDQTIVLAHYQDPSGSRSGLSISNRPEHSILDAQEQLGLEPGASREQMVEAIQRLPEDERAARLRELFGVNRAFFGSNSDGTATLVLKDGDGRDRVVIEAPREGDPSIVLLDDEGEPILRLPE